MLIVMITKKLITLSTTVIIAGVILYGSGSVFALNTVAIQTAEKYGMIQIGMENNASFLAPMPMNIYMKPMCMEKSACTQTFLYGYLLSPRIMCNN